MAIAIYRKYRPKSLSDIVGQEHVSETIKNAAKLDRISHAYLFYGERGCGKTTTARILAKIVNCEKRLSDTSFRGKGEPCNECNACKLIDQNKTLDIVEIDAASNRGVDEIRSLKEGIRVSPVSISKKVFIIDEVHQLTKDAFNALLKTLEEPPEHAIFILATTEYDKLPATIVSRVQRYNFKKISIPKIINRLLYISKEEEINISKEALSLIAESAEGSIRDALTLFEQVVLMEDSEITTEEVERIFGKAGISKISSLADSLIAENFSDGLKGLSEIENEGYNLTQLMKDLIRYMRRVAILKQNKSVLSVFEDELTEESISSIRRHAEMSSSDKNLIILKELIDAYGEMKYSPFAIIPFEMAIISLSEKFKK